MRDGSASGGGGGGGGMFGGGPSTAGMGFPMISELCRGVDGHRHRMGVSLGLTVPTIAGCGTLAQQERCCPNW